MSLLIPSRPIGGLRTRIKFCGLTREADIDEAVRLGVDALGFVFYPPSKRAISLERASALSMCVPAFVQRVALFVNPEPHWVRQVISALQPSLLQFHGDESPEFCTQFDLPYLKACRVGAPGVSSAHEIAAWREGYAEAAGILYDTFTPAYGGSGKVFDWSLIPLAVAGPPVVLSGGLTAANLAEALRLVRPYAVDVSSGIESAPGQKCALRMTEFVQICRQFDLQARALDSSVPQSNSLEAE